MQKPTYNLGDVMDKLSILNMKIYAGDEGSISEHRYIEKGLAAYGINGKIATNLSRLQLMNRMIWELENELRNGGESKFTLEEIGRKAIKIRDLNKKRIEYKNIINDIAKNFKESKIQHRSS